MNKLHVLLIPSWYPSWQTPTRGIFFKEQAEALWRAGVDVGVVYPELLSLRSFSFRGIRRNHFQITLGEESGVPTVRIHGWNIPRLKIGVYLRVRLAMRLVDLYVQRFGKPDLFHAHSVLWGGYVATLVAQKYGIPYVITEHSSAYARALVLPWQGLYIRESLCKAAKVIAVSHSLATLLRKYSPEKEIQIVPNVVNTDFFTLPSTPRAIKPFRFLTVASLIPNKGIDVLIRAFAWTFRDQSDVCLEVGGDGPQRAELEALAESLKIEDKVRFIGFLSRDQVRDAMWRANVFVLASFQETFGVVLIEALATGLSVIATRSGGPEDFVWPQVGWLVESGNMDDLARCLKHVYGNYLQVCTREPEIRKYAMQHFSEKAVTEMLLESYNQILESRTI